MTFFEKIFGCSHDWEVIKSTTILEIENEIRHKLNIAREVMRNDLNPTVNKVVCLKCGKYVDNISEHEQYFLKLYKNRIKKEKQRKLKAKQILKEKGIKI